MKLQRKHLSVLAALSLAASSYAATDHPLINEIMQSNVQSFLVEHDFPDSWVELYNPTTKAIDISGWTIGIKKTAEKGYKIPATTEIPANGYLIIYCDKEANGLHTSFRLESTSEGSVYLFNSAGNVVDKIDHDKMPAPDIAYGRKNDGSDTWSFFVTASPGKSNTLGTAVVNAELLPQPEFSVDGGIFSSPVSVTVRFPADFNHANAILCVTTDGRVPTDKDRVTSPFTLNISESTPVRAVIRSANALSQLPVSHTYLFPGREITMPVVCLTTDPDLLYDKEIGLLAGSENEANPNYRQKWRRPINIEFFDGDRHEQVINQVGETSPQGWSSLQWPQKSLKLYANKRFGTKRFEHIIWPDSKPDLEKVPSFSLRNGGNTFCTDHLRDAYYHRLFSRHVHGTVEYQAYRPAVAFINGKPYGLIDLRERSNEDHIESNYPDEEDFCMVEDWKEFKTDITEPFNLLKSLYNDPTSTFEQIDDQIDMVSFATSLIADAFGFNVDTPEANKVMWKPQNGKWKWFLKDMDCVNTAKLVDNDYIDYLNMVECDEYESWYKNTPSATALYRKCLSFPEFTRLMIDRFVAYYGDFLHPGVTVPLFQEMAEEIDQEFKLLAELYGFDYWLMGNVAKLQDYMRKRGTYIFNNLARRYQLGSIVPMHIENDEMSVSVNNHQLNYPTFEGSCFSARPVILSAPRSGDWSVVETLTDGTKTTRVYHGDILPYLAAENVTAVTVTFTKGAAIETIINEDASNDNGPVVYYSLDGRRLSDYPTSSGIYIKVQGESASKILIR